MKKVLFTLCLLTLCNSVFALQVDIDEIRKTKKIQFENYRGKVNRSDSIAAVSAIGTGLAEEIKKSGVSAKASYMTKYSVIHAVSKDEPEKLAADIFAVDRDSRVTHIDSIRRIVSAYLESAYGYSRKSSDAIAIYLSYYNAVHRGDLPYFSSKYKNVVMKHLSKTNAGISTKYYDWAGKTKMLIPLTDEAQLGDPGSIDPEIVADKKTTEEIRKDDRNIEPRKEIAELKEKSIEKEKAKVEEKKKETAKEVKAVEEKKKEVEKQKQDISKKEAQIGKEKEENKKITSEPQKKKKEEETAKKEEALKKEKEVVAKKEETVKAEEKKTEQKKEEIQKQEEKIVQKEKNLKEEKKEIAKDEVKKEIKENPKKAADQLEKKADTLEKKEKELDKREDALKNAVPDKNIFADRFFYLKIKDYIESGHYNNELYMINPATKKIEFKSPVTNICGSRYDIFSEGIVIITHNGNHKEGHRLTLVDREKLTARINGTDNIFWRSFVEIRDSVIYAIIYDKGSCYLGRFDAELKLTARSNEKISENTFISFYENFVYINSLDKKIIVLKKEDLSLVDTIAP